MWWLGMCDGTSLLFPVHFSQRLRLGAIDPPTNYTVVLGKNARGSFRNPPGNYTVVLALYI